MVALQSTNQRKDETCQHKGFDGVSIRVPFFSTSQAFAADDVKSAAVALAKIYKLESLASEFLFGSFSN